jgi:hypothetical protein
LRFTARFEWNAGADQRAFEPFALADPNAAAIQLRTATATGGEFFATNRIEHDRMFELAAIFARNRHREMRNAVNEVGGAVERVDDPAIFGIAGATAASFFAEECVIGVGFSQQRNNFALGCSIDLGNEIVRGFFIDADFVDLIGGARNEFAGLTGSFESDGEHRLHEGNYLINE